VKHDLKHKKKSLEENSYKEYLVPSYFYPVTSGIYVGDQHS
jgi:hypothetical protein